jgi:uncharacterized protein (TIGR02996 family)
MHDAFLRSLLDSPRDDASRLVYADWLEEQDTPTALLQAEYLRLTVEVVNVTQKRSRKKIRKRLQELAAQFETDWLVIVSRIPVENCGRKSRNPYSPASMFRFLCDRDWSDMEPTGDNAVRHCTQCAQNVHYCATIKEAREHSEQGHCVALDLGVVRHEHDLEPRRVLLGRIRRT